MVALTPFHELNNRLGKGEIDFSTHAFRAYLSNVAPNQANHTVKADIAEIAAGFGYLALGQALTSVTWTETAASSGIWQLTCADLAWTAAGGDIATHRYLIVYDDTHASDALIGFLDRGASAVITSGNTRTWDVGATGIYRLSSP